MSTEGNTAPVVVVPIADQYVLGGVSYSFSVGSTFYDPDPGDQLVYSAALEDGSALPGWLTFDSGALSFTTTPDIYESGVISVRLSATDISGAPAMDVFDIFVFGPNLTIYGTAGDDLLKGAGGVDEIYGLAGNDVIYGYASRDMLDGGAGNDVLNGGDGSDTYLFGIGSGTDTIVNGDSNPSSSWDIVSVTGAVSLADVEFELIGQDPSMRIISSGDRLVLSGLATSANADQIDEVQFSDGSRANVLLGTSQNDFLFSNGGTDILAGFEGDDYLSGWSDADIYIYTANGGFDTISDFVDPGRGNELWFVGVGSPESLTLSLYGTVLIDNQAVVQISGFNRNDVVGSNVIQTFRFDDGSVLSYQDLLARGFDIYAPPWGQEHLFGTNATDRFHGSEYADGFSGDAGDDFIYGFGGADVLNGDDANDYLDGGAGDDSLDGGLGVDIMLGGEGNDVFYVDDSADLVVENANEGFDTVGSWVNYVLGPNIEQLFLFGNAGHAATGNDLDNVLGGSNGNDVLDGGAGADTYFGSLGDDVYVVDNNGDVIRENAGEGTDTVQSSLSFMLTDNLENLTLTGTNPIAGTGNALNNVLTGNVAANVLTGGLGDDTYVIEDAADTVIENVDEGKDTITAGLTYTLGQNVENLTLTGTSAINGTGNALDNVLIGNSAGNTLTGGAGNDTLDGAGGTDSLIGGVGNDTYVVANLGVVVTENGDEGTDTVNSSVTYTLAANVENLKLTGATAINGTGNALDNVLTGNGAANILRGLGGNDWLDGGAGADILIGGPGDDTYVVDNVGDIVVSELAGEGIDTVWSSVSYSLGNSLENLSLYGTAIKGTGNSLDNVLTGNVFANVLTGGFGDDTYVIDGTDTVIENAYEGTDTIQIGLTYTLGANLENLTLTGAAAINGTGNSQNNVLLGNGGVNVLTGLDGSDWLDAGAGADTLAGGAGDDTYVVDDAGDVVLENAAEGIDTVMSSVSYVLTANVENLTLTGPAAINGNGNSLDNMLTGNSARNTLTGGAGNDMLDGGSGADIMIGGLGDDTYFVDNTGDVVIESAGAGFDTVYAEVTSTLSANVEDLTLTGTSAINGTGNSLGNVLLGNTAANVLTGLAGDDFLDGDAGADTLVGGAGDDTYVVDDSGDRVIENANEGNDTVWAWFSYTLTANLENLTLIADASNATGNTLNNVLTGNYLDNVLDGGLGADTMRGQFGNDTYVVDNTGDAVIEFAYEGIDLVKSSFTYTLGENLENLTLLGTLALNGTGNELDNLLTGNSARNTLTGGVGNDTLDGGAGADTLIGGPGADTYIVDSAADTVTERAGEGSDTVVSSITITLAANVEGLVLIGTSAINGTGNALNNLLAGNSANNTLSGGAGTDTMLGGTGDDIYIVDNVGDGVVENFGEGADLVQSSVTYALNENLENLTLTGTSAINGAGNALDNVLIGNRADNTLLGGAGNDTILGGGGVDTMAGGSGDDTYTVDSVTDVVTEMDGEGTDLIQSSVTLPPLVDNVENLTLTGTTAINGMGNVLDNVITGNSGKNTLTGYGGNDTLIGLAGGDTMIGGYGDDIYVVDAANDVVIENFAEGSDTIQSIVGWTLSANFENLILTGAAAINGTGNAVANLLVGNTGNNALIGLAGNDILQGLAGNDILNDNAGNTLFDGGAGTDIMNGSAGNEMFIGGLGNDTITTGAGADIIVFNAGGGQDIVNASTGEQNVLSLGGGIGYGGLTFTKSGKNLILKTGGTDQITFKDWYAQASNRSVATLQIFTEAMSGYNPTGGSTLLDNKVEQFNFTELANAFDTAGQVNGWALTNALLATNQWSSDTEAIGGDLAYQYGLNGNLAGIGLAQAQQVLNAPQFGSGAQTLRPAAELQQGQIRLA